MKIKISTKVGKGMIVAGLVGGAGSICAGMYAVYKNNHAHPELTEINQEMETIIDDSPQCFPSPLSRSYECAPARERYDLLLERKVQLKQSGAYQQFLEDQEHYNDLESWFFVGGGALSLALFWGGAGVYLRRERERQLTGALNALEELEEKVNQRHYPHQNKSRQKKKGELICLAEWKQQRQKSR